jgi:hypothetical protein
LHPNVVLQDLHTLKDIEGARNHFLKLVEMEVDQNVTIPCELIVPLLIKVQLGLFHLLRYMLKKFDWENSPLDDFKGRFASYRTCLEGWDEWIYHILWHHLVLGFTEIK